MMGVSIKLDYRAIQGIGDAVRIAAQEAMDVVLKDIINSETMPKNDGTMQDEQTFVANEGDDTINGEDIYSLAIVTGSPQARRLYYHPEYNFQRGKNKNAGALWLEPYINGDKKDLLLDEYTERLKEKLE